MMNVYENENSYYKNGAFIGTCLVFITIATLIHKSIFTFYCSIALFLYFGITIMFMFFKRRIPTKSFFIIFAFISLMSFSFLVNNGSVGSLLNYITTLLFIEMCSSFRFSKEQFQFTRVVSVIGIFYIFIRSITYASSWFYYRYNDINPNTLGMATLFCLLYYICSSIEIGINRNIFQIALHIFLVLIVALSMVNLEARGTLIALLFFLLLLLIPKKLLTGKRLLFITIVLIIIGVFVPYIFLELYSRHFNLVFLNKSLYTGREFLWSTMLRLLNRAPYGWLLGVGSESISDAARLSNVHNDYFVTIYTFGIFGFLLFEIFIVMKLNDAIQNMEVRHTSRYWIYMFISSVIVLGYTESVTHWAPLFIFAFLSLGMAQISFFEDDKLKGVSL